MNVRPSTFTNRKLLSTREEDLVVHCSRLQGIKRVVALVSILSGVILLLASYFIPGSPLQLLALIVLGVGFLVQGLHYKNEMRYSTQELHSSWEFWFLEVKRVYTTEECEQIEILKESRIDTSNSCIHRKHGFDLVSKENLIVLLKDGKKLKIFPPTVEEKEKIEKALVSILDCPTFHIVKLKM